MTEDSFRLFYWEPHAVVETRRIRDKSRDDYGAFEFMAEVAFGTEHRVTGGPFKTREEATACAQKHVDAIKTALFAAVKAEIGHFPIAKE